MVIKGYVLILSQKIKQFPLAFLEMNLWMFKIGRLEVF